MVLSIMGLFYFMELVDELILESLYMKIGKKMVEVMKFGILKGILVFFICFFCIMVVMIRVRIFIGMLI